MTAPLSGVVPVRFRDRPVPAFGSTITVFASSKSLNGFASEALPNPLVTVTVVLVRSVLPLGTVHASSALTVSVLVPLPFGYVTS